jgi:uncharacterized protein YoxC
MRNRVFAAAAGLLALSALADCGGKVQPLRMRDGKGEQKQVDFPKGTVFGDISQEQVRTMAQMLADENLATAERLDTLSRMAAESSARVEEKEKQIEAGVQGVDASVKKVDEAAGRIEAGEKKLQADVQGVDAAVQKVDAGVQKVAAGESRLEEGQKRLAETADKTLEATQKTFDTTRMIIEAFEKVARRQGTGELTVFFPVGSARIEKGALQHKRIVEFTDWLAREARGRKIMLVSVGSASAFGPKGLNEKLAKERSEAPLAVIDQYLINLPHEFVKIYGTGDLYSPSGVTRQEHERYQHARLIAFYEKGQEPALPAPKQP